MARFLVQNPQTGWAALIEASDLETAEHWLAQQVGGPMGVELSIRPAHQQDIDWWSLVAGQEGQRLQVYRVRERAQEPEEEAA